MKCVNCLQDITGRFMQTPKGNMDLSCVQSIVRDFLDCEHCSEHHYEPEVEA